MSFEVGETVGSYQIVSRLQASEKGVSFKAHNAVAQRFEILKVLPKELQVDGERVERFLREAKLHSKLNHPNIAAFYNAMELEGRLVLTTELVEGATLEQRIQIGSIPVEIAIDYVDQVLSALRHAHELGIVHRNLSPAVMVMTGDRSVKLTGFDMAKTSQDPQLTAPGSVVGSVDYIAPEQVMGTQGVDARADIYAVGAVLYELLTGEKLFSRSSKFETMLAHVQAQPQPPIQHRPDLPQALNDAILKAIAKNPDDRFENAAEFSEAIRSAAGLTARAPQAASAASPSDIPSDAQPKATPDATREEPPAAAPVPVPSGATPAVAGFAARSAVQSPVPDAAAVTPPPALEADTMYLLKVGGLTFLVATAAFALFLFFVAAR